MQILCPQVKVIGGSSIKVTQLRQLSTDSTGFIYITNFSKIESKALTLESVGFENPLRIKTKVEPLNRTPEVSDALMAALKDLIIDS